MTRDPIGDAEVRSAVVRAHQGELLAEAARDRQARAGQCDEEPPGGLRRRLGLALVRAGQALAGEGARRPGRSHAMRQV